MTALQGSHYPHIANEETETQEVGFWKGKANWPL